MRFIIGSCFLIVLGIAIPSQLLAQRQDLHKMKINETGFTSSKVCAQCHVEIYAKWKNSLHAMSTTDPIFRASYIEAHYKSKGKAERICLRCHAPTSSVTQNYNLDTGITSEGVTCDFCHSLKGVDLSKKEYPFLLDLGLVKYGPNREGNVKVHNIKYSKLHTGSRICASCHEYTPNGVGVMTTYSEWKMSSYAAEGKACQFCHMPKIEGQITNFSDGARGKKVFSHRLAGGYSLMQLKKTTRLKIKNIIRGKDRMTVTVDVSNIESGHKLPTGMPSRKLVLYCEVRGAGRNVYKEKVVYEKVIFDKNGFELTSDAEIMLGYGSSIAKDNRLSPKETRTEKFTFYIPGTKRVSVVVWLDYLYQPVVAQETEMRIEMTRDNVVSAAKTTE